MCVAGRCLSGAWSPRIIQAMKDNVLSINPLELLTCAMTLSLARQEHVLHKGARVVWRNDNESAITDLNKDRANSAAMLEALVIVKETVAWTKIEVYGQHISTDDNKVADLLSRGKTGEALEVASTFFGPHKIDFNDMFNRLVDAAYKGAGRRFPRA